MKVSDSVLSPQSSVLPSQQPPRLVVWDQIEVRVSGERIAQIVGEEIVRRRIPISHLTLQFDSGALRVEGRLQKGFGVPFTVLIERIDASGTVVRVPLTRATAFGIPLPMVLLKIAQQFIPPGDIAFDHAAQSFSVRLDRFLPPFIDVEIAAIKLIGGGVAVRLGPGGADPPLPT